MLCGGRDPGSAPPWRPRARGRVAPRRSNARASGCRLQGRTQKAVKPLKAENKQSGARKGTRNEEVQARRTGGTGRPGQRGKTPGPSRAPPPARAPGASGCARPSRRQPARKPGGDRRPGAAVPCWSPPRPGPAHASAQPRPDPLAWSRGRGNNGLRSCSLSITNSNWTSFLPRATLVRTPAQNTTRLKGLREPARAASQPTPLPCPSPTPFRSSRCSLVECPANPKDANKSGFRKGKAREKACPWPGREPNAPKRLVVLRGVICITATPRPGWGPAPLPTIRLLGQGPVTPTQASLWRGWESARGRIRERIGSGSFGPGL